MLGLLALVGIHMGWHSGYNEIILGLGGWVVIAFVRRLFKYTSLTAVSRILYICTTIFVCWQISGALNNLVYAKSDSYMVVLYTLYYLWVTIPTIILTAYWTEELKSLFDHEQSKPL